MALGATQANTQANATGGEVFSDSDDEEMDEEQKARHEAFNKQRKGHYSKEAFAILKGKELIEDDLIDDDEGEGEPSQGLGLRVNGVA